MVKSIPGRVFKAFLGWIFPAHLRVLEVHRSKRDGRSQPIICSAETMMRCSHVLHRHRGWKAKLSQLLQEVLPLLGLLDEGP